MVRIVPPCR